MSVNFLGINLSNSKVPIRAVGLNGLTLERTNYGLWVKEDTKDPLPLRAPYELVLLGANRQRLQLQIAALVAQDLGVNFVA